MGFKQSFLCIRISKAIANPDYVVKGGVPWHVFVASGGIGDHFLLKYWQS